MKFTKMHGAGNDFVVVETGDARRDWSTAAMALCDRHYGVGSDGLLLVMPSDVADVRMRMFDPDGSEAEACGNGIRCVAKYAFEEKLTDTGTDRLLIETIAGIRQIKLIKEENKLVKIQAGMGKPMFGSGDIPVEIGNSEKIVYINTMISYPARVSGKDLLFNFVSMGNPHAVCFMPDPVAGFPLSEIGPEVENLDIFPKRANFEVARVLNRGEIEVRVWERGAGETLACGSGACAVTVAARLYEYIEDNVKIKLPGGILQVSWDGAGEVLLSGPAEKIFTGEWLE